ncbi:MAG: hypothetical protein JXA10_03030 [Anaerolineae bacterium]|nr:hypothetical protein [Anaerolineae bacterium]
MSFSVTTVEAYYTPDGWPVPSTLRWNGVTLRIINHGRRWRHDDGIHMLVMVADGRVFELHTNGSLWRAKVVSDPGHFA